MKIPMKLPLSASTSTTPLTYAILGCAAGIAQSHLAALRRLPDTRIVGMADLDTERGAAQAAHTGCPFFADHHDLLAALHPDIAIICAPHPAHAALALDCLAAGCHVLVEKPLAVEMAEADTLIAAADAANRLLAVNFQQRFLPAVERARRLIAAGDLGPLVRTLCVEPWFRTDAYYRSAPWRGTWRGEGGGVLMNQGAHTLDLLCLLAGSPTQVHGWTRTLAHRIETEDTAQALLEYPNGAPGYVYVGTGEAGGPRRLEIVGDRGAIELIGGKLIIRRFRPALSVFRASSPALFAQPVIARRVARQRPGDGGGHLAVHRDLRDAIRTGRPPRCDAREARRSLELANAIIASGATGQSVTLPLDRPAYSALLADLRAGRPVAPWPAAPAIRSSAPPTEPRAEATE